MQESLDDIPRSIYVVYICCIYQPYLACVSRFVLMALPRRSRASSSCTLMTRHHSHHSLYHNAQPLHEADTDAAGHTGLPWHNLLAFPPAKSFAGFIPALHGCCRPSCLGFFLLQSRLRPPQQQACTLNSPPA